MSSLPLDEPTRAGSTCSSSSYDSVSSSTSSPSRQSSLTYEAILMPEPPRDLDAEAQSIQISRQRRAWKRDVFNNALVDWKSIPAFELSDLDRDHLLRRPHLRCDSSPHLKSQIIASARLRPMVTTSTTASQPTSSSEPLNNNGSPEAGSITVTHDQGNTTITIDGEDIVDMIG